MPGKPAMAPAMSPPVLKELPTGKMGLAQRGTRVRAKVGAVRMLP